MLLAHSTIFYNSFLDHVGKTKFKGRRKGTKNRGPQPTMVRLVDHRIAHECSSALDHDEGFETLENGCNITAERKGEVQIEGQPTQKFASS